MSLSADAAAAKPTNGLRLVVHVLTVDVKLMTLSLFLHDMNRKLVAGFRVS